MVDFWDPHKMATKKRAFSALLYARNESENKKKKKLWKKERKKKREKTKMFT